MLSTRKQKKNKQKAKSKKQKAKSKKQKAKSKKQKAKSEEPISSLSMRLLPQLQPHKSPPRQNAIMS
jgi:hypothetical protein